MTPAERRARRLLAAYPWRVRAEQGDEILGTVLDTLPPDTARLPWRAQLDLVRGGIRMRRQRRPPWLTVLAYSFGLRISARWIRWVYDDVERPGYAWVAAWRAFVGALLASIGLALVTRTPPLILLYCIIFPIVAARRSERDRARVRARYGLVAGGSDPSVVWVERDRPATLPDLGIGAIALAVGGATTLGSAVTTWSAANPAPETAPAGLGQRLAVTIHPPATGSLGSAVLAGFVPALVLIALAAIPVVRAAGRPPRARRPSRGTAPVAAILGAMGGVATAANAIVLRWQWVAADTAVMVGGLVVPSAAVAVIGAVVVVVGRRRGAPIGLWDLAPRLAPRPVVLPVARWSVDPARDRIWTGEAR